MAAVSAASDMAVLSAGSKGSLPRSVTQHAAFGSAVLTHAVTVRGVARIQVDQDDVGFAHSTTGGTLELRG